MESKQQLLWKSWLIASEDIETLIQTRVMFDEGVAHNGEILSGNFEFVTYDTEEDVFLAEYYCEGEAPTVLQNTMEEIPLRETIISLNEQLRKLNEAKWHIRHIDERDQYLVAIHYADNKLITEWSEC